MNILIIAPFEGWVKTYLTQLGNGLCRIGNHVEYINYRLLDKSLFSFLKNDDALSRHRNLNLEKLLKKTKPDAVLFVIARMNFDFEMIKTYYKGKILVYDVDGPAWGCYNELSWLKHVDCLFTASRVSQRMLQQNSFQAFYLAGFVDPEHYKMMTPDNDLKEKYGAPVSFVGRPTPRRNEFLSEITECGLKLWGRKWHDETKCPVEKLQKCSLYDKDIFEDEVVKVYNASDLYVNILREPLNESSTILSLQAYAVPSCGTCIVQEWVEELDEAFEDGKEIISFKTKAEFAESVKKYSKDKDAARKIGEAGRNRVLKCHTHEHRAHELINFLTS